MTIRIVGLGGSLKTDSTSLAALKVALEGASEAGAETELLSVRELDLPLFSPEVAPTRDARRLADAVAGADGLIWSSPLYHGSVSGSFKNAVDWLQLLSDRDPPYLSHKVVGLVATAGGVQGLQAVNTMEFVVRALRGWAVPLVIPVARAWEAFDGGEAVDDGVIRQLTGLGAEVVGAAARFSTDGSFDGRLVQTGPSRTRA
ncbi:MAG TPA: NAD(P)H-dependent oxidoreductase [Actinomycetota bacterium]|nr:NAD(P)H-dependent oxidoreductase [Actinomycetota bacterium]